MGRQYVYHKCIENICLFVLLCLLCVVTSYLFFVRNGICTISMASTENITDNNNTMGCTKLWSIMWLLLSTGKPLTEGLSWSWKCISNKCVKQESLVNCKSDDPRNGLEICRLICGQYGSIWPHPTGETKLSKEIIAVHPDRVIFDLQIISEIGEMSTANKLMKQMNQQFIQDMKTICLGNCLRVLDTELLLKIQTSSPETDLTWGTDEAYALKIKTYGVKIYVTINAITIFGARHGLQTLFQLMTAVSKNNSSYLVLIKDAFIIDRPVYPHRGLLIDTSRHYLHVNTIKRTIDGMGLSKLNVLHWHITDSHSFPLKVPRVPEMSIFGAYSPDEIYILQDITDLINYGKKRGVRIIVEIDSPSHAGNGWQWGPFANLGDLALCINQQPWRSSCIQPPCGQLNPSNPNMYKIIGLIYRDLVSVFPKREVFHMGGDEVKFACWNSSDDVVKFMQKAGLHRDDEGFLQLWADFHEKLLQILDNIVGTVNTPIIIWSSHLTESENVERYLDKERFVIQTWVESSRKTNIDDLLDKGYKIIVSTKNAWYLDHGVWGNTKYYSWSEVYNNRIPNVSAGVLGGEVCMWGEYVDDSAIDGRIWPRAAAAAERLWSNPPNKSSQAQYRFLHHRERLVKMGIRAEAVTPQWCYQNEDLCL